MFPSGQTWSESLFFEARSDGLTLVLTLPKSFYSIRWYWPPAFSYYFLFLLSFGMFFSPFSLLPTLNRYLFVFLCLSLRGFSQGSGLGQLLSLSNYLLSIGLTFQTASYRHSLGKSTCSFNCHLLILFPGLVITSFFASDHPS